MLAVMLMLVMLMVAASPLTSASHPSLSPGRSTTAGGWGVGEGGEGGERGGGGGGGKRRASISQCNPGLLV